MRIFVIAVILAFSGFIAFSYFIPSGSDENDSHSAHQLAFTNLFKDNIDEGKQDFFFIGTHCMTVEADLDLPEYFTEHYNELAAAAIIFLVKKGVQSPKDPAYIAFKEELLVDFEDETASLNEQIAQETDVMQDAMKQVALYVDNDENGLQKCVGDRLVEEQSTTSSSSN